MASQDSTLVIDKVTVTSLLAVLVLLVSAYLSSLRLLPRGSSTKVRILFVWHLFDALIHFFFEGSFLYNCFFTSLHIGQRAKYEYFTGRAPLELYPKDVHFLGRKDRYYGSFYGTNPTALLWQEYAKADARWGGADLGVVSLELLTVFLGGPIASYICYLLTKGYGSTGTTGSNGFGGKLVFWMTVLATGELYGGFMTFCPEWLTGSPNLDTSNFMYLWVYLVFFNMLWVVIPFWILYETYRSMTGASPLSEAVASSKDSKKLK
ncbi:uncharacterized protein PV09_07872 [Verruconis gallopava]|uniref:EXPERA domain-containing protein n=1 Tax=Verruconis gallopava TaxID=253628 RepID=A0A0D2A1R9_9PEZI|nr:uncharacterized protein PV09_07872 [Verruconis gallopava]KIW00688.1 hypothetical protein PV09_07872 [Verruconis gallopava]